MPSLVVIGPQIKEPAYMVPKDPNLNRVKANFHLRWNDLAMQ